MFLSIVHFSCLLTGIVFAGCTCSEMITDREETPVINQVKKPIIPEGVALLSWNNYDGLKLSDPKVAEYILNGQEMGKGEKGFMKVVSAIADHPGITELWIYPDEFVLDTHSTPTGNQPLFRNIKSVPFKQSDVLDKKLQQLALRHGFKVLYLAAAPGEITWGDKEDLKLSEKERNEIMKWVLFRDREIMETKKPTPQLP